MYADDQDEEVEEEEEFHEVEEEKHKTSPDAANDSGSNHKKAPEKTIPSAPAKSTDVDWANIMMRSQPKDNDVPTEPELSSNSVSLSDIPSGSKDTEKPSDDSIINNIIKETEDKLKIVDEPCDSTHQKVTQDQIDSEQHAGEPTVEVQVGDDLQSGSDQPRTSSQSDVSFASPNLDSSPKQQLQSSSSLDENVMPEQDSPVDLTGERQTSDLSQNPEEAQNQIDLENQPAPDHDPKSQGDDPPLDKPVELDPERIKSDLDAKEANQLETDEKKSEDPEKKELDLDEDVKNPQYIPKKGVFYEHDDRSHDVEEKNILTTQKEGDEVETKEANASKRTSSQDKQAESRRTNRKQRTDADRWNHDLFRGEKQKPKSKSELVNAYGYDIRQERAGRSQQSDSRQSRSGKSFNSERNTSMQDGQQSRQTKDSRIQRQNQPGNRSRDRRSRRQNVSKVNQQQQRNDGTPGEIKRDTIGSRPARNDVRDSRDGGDKEAVAAVPSVPTNTRRDQDVPQMNRNTRNDSRGRRKSSRERQSNDERLPLTNTVMPPITTWSNEDMMKAEAFGKGSPSRAQNVNTMTATGSNNQSIARDRSSELWQQGQQNKTIYQDRPPRNQDESRQQGYNSRGRYQDRGDENHRPAHYLPRNQYHDRTNQNQDWHRANNFGSYGKPNDYVVKTQTFENSRLSQANMGRSNNRDLREVINERRMQGQTYHNKIHHGVEHHVNSRGPNQGQLFQHQYAQPHMVMQQHHMAHNQQQPPQMLMMQSQQHQQSQQTPRHMQMPMGSQQQAPSPPQPQVNSQTSQAQLTNHRQQPTTTQSQSHQVSSRQSTLSGSTVEQDSARGSSSSTSTDPANSRPIIKTDAYTGNMHSHQQHAGQLSQGHRSMGGPMSQQNSAPTTSHMVPTHLGSATQPQYYTPSPGSRDPSANAAAVASAYHGYLPGGHAVMDAARYHMASQQLTDHGYMANPNQTGDVSGGVVHQQGMYPDTSAGGAVANSTYMAQHPSSTISPNSIPVTGAGAQLPPVPYIQHSQYPPPPYSNPYTQPQHNQGPPQSSHAYPPYWTYI